MWGQAAVVGTPTGQSPATPRQHPGSALMPPGLLGTLAGGAGAEWLPCRRPTCTAPDASPESQETPCGHRSPEAQGPWPVTCPEARGPWPVTRLVRAGAGWQPSPHCAHPRQFWRLGRPRALRAGSCLGFSTGRPASWDRHPQSQANQDGRSAFVLLREPQPRPRTGAQALEKWPVAHLVQVYKCCCPWGHHGCLLLPGSLTWEVGTGPPARGPYGAFVQVRKRCSSSGWVQAGTGAHGPERGAWANSQPARPFARCPCPLSTEP